MKKTVSLILALTMCLCGCLFAGCGSTQDNSSNADFAVAVCQLMEHDSLDKATQGFVDALKKAMEDAGKTVSIDIQVAGEPNLCTTVVSAQLAKNPDLIMGNATPALLAAANATTSIPVLGTSVTDYADTFKNNIPANVSGTSDAVPFAEQAQMMIDTLKLVEGDKVGVDNGKVYRKYLDENGVWQTQWDEWVTAYTPAFSEFTVGKNEIFFLGDNRAVSDDSRSIGCRKLSEVVGVVTKFSLKHKNFLTKLFG